MDPFISKNYSVYANFLNKLAKDLTRYYYSKLNRTFKVSNKLKGKGYDPVTTSDKAFEKWTLNKVVMRHAVGEKGVEEPVVVVGASSAHRDACFEACRFLIDTLKETVPIWKKEKFKNKSVWVSAHP